jgi:murein DD-endopeptidase MepM/ murein hydrolase activator NlpD
VRRAGLALAIGLAAAGAAGAVGPPPPSMLQVVPVYSSPPAIKLTWFDTAGTGPTTDTIFRSVNGAAETVVLRFPALAAGTARIFTDPGASSPTSSYAYRVQACDPIGCNSTVPFTTSPRVVWPDANGHEVLHGFNEPIGWAGIDSDSPPGACTPTGCPLGPPTGFHDGLDLNTVSAHPGDLILAPRGGVVIQVVVTGSGIEPDNGNVAIQVDVGGGVMEMDSFNHISTDSAATPQALLVDVGTVVAPGQPIGVIGTRWFEAGDFTNHVHYLLSSTAVTHRNARNNLLVFTDRADRDPLDKPPSLFDENGDGKVVLYRYHSTQALVDYDPDMRPLSGDVDIEPEVTDEQGHTPRQAPLDLGYWIEGPLPDSEQRDDVKSPMHPYRLYDFRNVYFGLRGAVVPCGLISDVDDVANAGCKGQAAVGCPNNPVFGLFSGCDSVIKEGSTDFPYPVMHHFIVTHASGETGAPGAVSAAQYWRTNAKDDGVPVDGPQANYAGQPSTTKATEARFPDGDYTVHVVASDLNHPNVDLKLPQVTRIENFAPFIVDMLVAEDADGIAATRIPGLAGCELEVYHYVHKHGDPYPEAAKLAKARAAAAGIFLHTGVNVCVRIRFSEPMSAASVDLVARRGTGIVVGALSGAFAKKFQANDTWVGAGSLTPDPTGASDSLLATDERDVAVRITAADRRDAADFTRSLDADGDGVPDGSDANTLVKVEISSPTKTLDVVKPQ